MSGPSPDLAVLADKVALGELVARYAWLVGQGRGPEVPALFTADGRFEGRNQQLCGQEDLVRFYQGAASGHGDVVPLVGNMIFDVSGDAASGVSTLTGHKRGTGVHVFSGVYEDDFAREEGRWLFRRRRFTTYFDLQAGG
ncbi:nuclear transport factor 2 family protein [Rhizorhabdus dicambivorans]|uniref:Nuclear transport factor 2 family protein n=1 Tax=Rhizorhabdus dicambivorans TaxID=1850238 RepID=A0A2A4FYF5_9SPHN|nr:nuclear transport factor 2 family protein [Rhizorhabdus dicambivorans]ATE63643.1 nuclear transport factor 2 family protein [Rhizorhabdus dicambivorans]PCE42771.1 nuclear transport factor 2 family protein [Rhizorhabdus dicambivorans]